MLSPGTWWKRVPRGKRENIEWRKWLLGRASANKRVREGLIEYCKKDILFEIKAFGWTYDPRKKARSLPFISYTYQDIAFLETLEAIEDQTDVVIEKSRDMGASWINLYTMDWLARSYEGSSFLMVSRKEDLVDSPGDPDSLFWKIDFIHRHLPEWLRPDVDRRKMHFGYRANGSTIDGETTTAAAGVGGRRTAMFIDEFSRIEEGYQLLAGTADTANCRIFNFTPWGTSNAAYKLARRTDIRKIRMHWSDHPEKAAGAYRFDPVEQQVKVIDKSYVYPLDFKFIMDGKLRSPWYDGECKRRANDREIAQMLDIDYAGSQYQFYDRSTILDLQREYGRPPDWEGDISFDADTGRPHELVKAHGGPLKLWLNLDPHGKPPIAQYAMGADLSTGTGATNSALSIVNCGTGEKVLEYATPFLRAEQMAPRATALCWLFKNERGEPCLMSWEMQGPGITFGKRVFELGFRHVYKRNNERDFTSTTTDTPGWVPTTDNKRSLHEEYRSALATGEFINHSVEALEECLAFIHTEKGTIEHSQEDGGDDPTGARVNHGDRVVPDALCRKMMKVLGYNVVKTSTPQKEQIEPGSLAWRRQLVHNTSKREQSWGGTSGLWER